MASINAIIGFCLFTIAIVSFAGAQRTLSVHILDNTNGGNAPNVTCKLYKEINGTFEYIATMPTNGNGRINTFLPREDFTPGTYRVWLDTKTYFEDKGIKTMWPAIQTTFYIRDPAIDHHIPFALSPFGFQTYRGA